MKKSKFTEAQIIAILKVYEKGMTLNARFLLTERTLFDLLYDKVDDWLNPSNKKS